MLFDVNSVRIGSTGHDSMGYSWKMMRDGNILSWDIEGIELPPNKVAPEDEGYVTFSADLGLKAVQPQIFIQTSIIKGNSPKTYVRSFANR